MLRGERSGWAESQTGVCGKVCKWESRTWERRGSDGAMENVENN